MAFKYGVPEFCTTDSIIIAGIEYEVLDGVIESEVDIWSLLEPLYFKQITN